MQAELLQINVKAVLPAVQGYALFLACSEKTFVVYVEPSLGEAIARALSNANNERPLTHDLIYNILFGLDVTIQHMVINDIDDKAFFARLFLKMQNELGTKLIEIDARPSDAMVLTLRAGSPIYVTQTVIDKVEDMTEALERIINRTSM